MGTKFDILDSIALTLDKGITTQEKISKSYKPTSKFLWSKSVLSLDTVITDSYKNGPNTRNFLKQHCGHKFHFSIPFMNFMKNNYGKTLQDAINEWHRLNEQRKRKISKAKFHQSINSTNIFGTFLQRIQV